MKLDIWNKEDRESLKEVASLVSGSPLLAPEFIQNPKAVMSVINQANKWGMDPFTVAENAFVTKQKNKREGTEKWTIAYSSQLILAAVNATAPIQGRLSFEYRGPWDKIIGYTKTTKNQWGKDVLVPGWDPEVEKEASVIVRAITDTGQELSHEVFMVQAGVRQSSIWATNPKLQMSYVAGKEFSRLYFSDVIMGVYSPEELEEPELKTVNSEERKQVNDEQAALLLEAVRERNEQGLEDDLDPEEVDELINGEF